MRGVFETLLPKLAYIAMLEPDPWPDPVFPCRGGAELGASLDHTLAIQFEIPEPPFAAR